MDAASRALRIPRYLAPLPVWLEDLALRYAWIIVAINLAGTAFGFWYYRFQFVTTPVVMWPWVPDSPLATFLMAMSLALWKLDRTNELINVLAFYGNIKLGLWTPFVLLAFNDAFMQSTSLPMYLFLTTSHLGMVLQAFLIYRYSRFPPWAIGGALLWYSIDLTVDYFIPIVGSPHHTTLPFADPMAVEIIFGSTAFLLAAWAAVVLTIWITAWAFLTHIHTRNSSKDDPHA